MSSPCLDRQADRQTRDRQTDRQMLEKHVRLRYKFVLSYKTLDREERRGEKRGGRRGEERRGERREDRGEEREEGRGEEVGVWYLKEKCTGRWRWRSSGTWPWARGRSRSRSGRGRILGAGSGGRWPAGPDQTQGWSGGPGGCGPQTDRSPHRCYSQETDQ